MNRNREPFSGRVKTENHVGHPEPSPGSASEDLEQQDQKKHRKSQHRKERKEIGISNQVVSSDDLQYFCKNPWMLEATARAQRSMVGLRVSFMLDGPCVSQPQIDKTKTRLTQRRTRAGETAKLTLCVPPRHLAWVSTNPTSAFHHSLHLLFFKVQTTGLCLYGFAVKVCNQNNPSAARIVTLKRKRFSAIHPAGQLILFNVLYIASYRAIPNVMQQPPQPWA